MNRRLGECARVSYYYHPYYFLFETSRLKILIWSERRLNRSNVPPSYIHLRLDYENYIRRKKYETSLSASSKRREKAIKSTRVSSIRSKNRFSDTPSWKIHANSRISRGKTQNWKQFPWQVCSFIRQNVGDERRVDRAPRAPPAALIHFVSCNDGRGLYSWLL